jgi:hypothetical protein
VHNIWQRSRYCFVLFLFLFFWVLSWTQALPILSMHSTSELHPKLQFHLKYVDLQVTWTVCWKDHTFPHWTAMAPVQSLGNFKGVGPFLNLFYSIVPYSILNTILLWYDWVSWECKSSRLVVLQDYLGAVAQGRSSCLACVRPWVLSPAWQKQKNYYLDYSQFFALLYTRYSQLNNFHQKKKKQKEEER